MQFVNDMLSGMAKVSEAPILPKSTVNDYITSVRPRIGAGFFFALDDKVRPKLTPGNILRLATLREYRVTRKLEKEILRLDPREWAACAEAFEQMKGSSWNQTSRAVKARERNKEDN